MPAPEAERLPPGSVNMIENAPRNPAHRRTKMKKVLLGSLLALSLASAACTDPAKDKAKATVSDPVKTDAPKPEEKKDPAANGTPTPAPAAAESLAFTQEGNTVGFIGAKVTAAHEGSFSAFTGTIELVEKDPTKSKLSLDIDMNGTVLKEGESPKLLEHLKSPDFFDVAKFPKTTFASTAITAGGGKFKVGDKEMDATHTVAGNLNFHGVEKNISFPAIITVADDAVTATSEFALKRSDFGVVYPGMAEDLIKEEVVIKFNLKVARKK
jgi:polyisoprenoid-binding protein YceI